jgi:predicted dehydrogenase
VISKILIVGLGSIGQRHLDIARELFPNANIQILRFKNNKCPKKADGVFLSIQDAIDFYPDIVVIANPASEHIRLAKVFSESGAHLLIEKPLSITSEGTNELITISKKNKKILMVGYNLRFLMSLKKFRDFVQNKTAGRVLSVRCEAGQFLPSWRPTIDYRDSVSAKKKLGGGVLLELSHEIDYLIWIFREIDWVKATLSKQSDLEIDVEDSAFLTLGRDNENDSLIISLNLDFIRQDKKRECVAICEKGTLRWNGITGAVDIFHKDSKSWEQIYLADSSINDSYINEWKHFVDCIENNKEPIISVYDGLKVLEVIEAARISSDLNSKVFLKKS